MEQKGDKPNDWQTNCRHENQSLESRGRGMNPHKTGQQADQIYRVEPKKSLADKVEVRRLFAMEKGGDGKPAQDNEDLHGRTAKNKLVPQDSREMW
jgi:hypothetical protein